ncbi:MAG TPA: DCC1-like thiol-disulfide oxidoreductase family protein [Acidimicrobiales bacterium]|nr:DCC1-like thiol-disulfide oxidoreductase family protein [Acidimicrobiales bacterium]
MADAPDGRYRVVRRGLAVVIGLRLATGSYASLAGQPDAQFRPPGVLAWMGGVPSTGVLVAVQVLGLAAAVTATAGWGVRTGGGRWAAGGLGRWVAGAALPLAWAALLFLTAVRTSGGKVQHNEVLLLLAAIPILCVPENRVGPDGAPAGRRHNVGWPIELAVVVIAVSYCAAGLAKLVHTGPSWVFSDNMRYVMYWAAQTPQPGVDALTATIADHGWLARLVAASILGLELVAPVIVVWARARPPFVAAAVALHLGTWATLGIDYWGWALAVVVVLLDWGGGRRSARRAVEDGERRGLLVHDGDCAFCTRSALWVARRAGRRVEAAAGSTLDLGALGLTAEQVATEVWWVPGHGRPEGGHRAVGRALLAVGGPWVVAGRALLLPVVAPVARPAYAWVARNRHRLPGATPACRIGAAPPARPGR